MNLNVFTHQKICFFIKFMISFGTYYGIDFGCVLASTLSPFRHLFGINVLVWGARFKYYCSMVCFTFFFAILRSKIKPLNLPRGSRGVRPPPQNRVSAPPLFQGCFCIDSAPFGGRFGDDLEGFSSMCSVVFCNIIDKMSV